MSSDLTDLVLQQLRESPEPLTREQLIERFPAMPAGKPDAKLRSILLRPEVGRAGRGLYLYFPRQVSGTTFRLPLVGKEAADGLLRAPAELCYALWFRETAWGRAAAEGIRTSAPCALPNGRQVRLEVAKTVAHFSCPAFAGKTFVSGGDGLRDWLRSEQPRAGDSLRIRIVDGETSSCEASLERLKQRDRERSEAQNREVADAVDHILRNEIRSAPSYPRDLGGWLVGMGHFRGDYPPDPLAIVLGGDPRFTAAQFGQIGPASRWDWLRARSPVNPGPSLDPNLLALLTGRVPAVPGGRAEASFDPLEEWMPWTAAVGVPVPAPAAAPAADPAARQQVLRLRVAPAGRRGKGLLFEAKGEDTLYDLDSALRDEFYDLDHMSGFYVRPGGPSSQEWLATIRPIGGIEEGENYELAALGLQPGDRMTYVYDFGDWMEHAITVEETVSPEPGASYPRLLPERGRGGR